MSLFGGMTAQPRTRNLVEIKAGKMHLRGTMVYPDKRKGLLYLYQGNDLLMHLCWKDRSNNAQPEDDLVIFPDEVEFKKVRQNTTGRVYVLKWTNNLRKLFFWLQEPKEDKDEEFCKKINELLNHPPTPGFGDDIDGIGGSHLLHPFMQQMANGAGGLDANDLSNVLRSLNPNEFASLLSSFGGVGSGTGLMPGNHRGGASASGSSQQPTLSSNTLTQRSTSSRPNTAPASTHIPDATATSTSRSSGASSRTHNSGTNMSSSAAAPKTTTSSKSKTNTIPMTALTNVLVNLGNNTPTNTEATTSASQSTTDLYNITTSENLVPLLINKDIQDKLRVHLPEGTVIPSTENEMKDSISSAQFRQTVTALSASIQSGELGPILVQFGYPDELIQAANQGDVQAFARALENHCKKSNEEKSSDGSMDTN